MAAPSREVITGSIKGTGAQLDVKTIGFRPKSVDLYVDTGAFGHWHAGMADASAHKRIAAGTGSKITTGGITPLSDGFRLGTDAQLNVSGAVIDYIVIAE